MANSQGDDPLRGAADDVLARAVDVVPEGEFKRFLVQVGWGGLILSVLIGNAGLAALMKALASGKAPLDTGAVETYISVFVLFTPFVLLFAIATWAALTNNVPAMPGPLYFFAAAVLWYLGTVLSLWLGGAVPIEALTGPTRPGYQGAGEYVLNSAGRYVEYYGLLPVVAGPVLGIFLGYWASLLTHPKSRS